jgi:hypothetical protein
LANFLREDPEIRKGTGSIPMNFYLLQENPLPAKQSEEKEREKEDCDVS